MIASRFGLIEQQQRSPVLPKPSKTPSHGRNLAEQSPYFESAMDSFLEWLSQRKPSHEHITVRRTGVTPDDMEDMVREWISRMTASNSETLTREPDGPALPAYIVDCPKLHVIPKKLLEYKLRWCDKWAYEVNPSTQ